MAAEHGWPIMSEAEYQRLRGLGLTQALRWAGIKSWQLPGIMRDGLRRFRSHSSEIKLFEGVPALIKQLAQSDSQLYILSTNTPETIREVLDRYELKEQITVLKRSALFGKHYAIRHLLSRQKYAAQEVWMIGDEVRDIEAAKRSGVRSAAVTWGLQSAEILNAAQPDALATNPAELLGILTG